MGNAVRHMGQAMALIIVGPLIVVGLALVVIWHDILASFVPVSNDFGQVVVSLVSLGAFIALMVLIFKFVKTQGFGLFRLT